MKHILTVTAWVNLVVRVVVWAICMGTWMILGFILWIPLLGRAIVNYTFNLVLVTFKPKTDIRISERGLEFAMAFYMSGFLRINNTMLQQVSPGDDGYEEIRMVQIWAFAKEAVYALIIWFIVLLLGGFIEFHPDKLWKNGKAKFLNAVESSQQQTEPVAPANGLPATTSRPGRR